MCSGHRRLLPPGLLDTHRCRSRPAQVTIKGNVMVCDACGRQVSMPMDQGGGSKQSLDARVRSYAQELGWMHTEQTDLCPEDLGIRPPT